MRENKTETNKISIKNQRGCMSSSVGVSDENSVFDVSSLRRSINETCHASQVEPLTGRGYGSFSNGNTETFIYQWESSNRKLCWIVCTKNLASDWSCEDEFLDFVYALAVSVGLMNAIGTMTTFYIKSMCLMLIYICVCRKIILLHLCLISFRSKMEENSQSRRSV